MGEAFPQPAILDNKGFFFLAEGARRIQDPCPDAGEDLEILRIPLSEFEGRIQRKEIRHGMVLLAFFFQQQFRRRPSVP